MPIEHYRLTRDGLPPITFDGEKIGSDSSRTSHGQEQNRWTEVHLYRTQGGKYVVSVVRRTQWQGESDRYSAASKGTAAEIIEWLKLDNESDKLGATSQEAVEQAVKVDQQFADAWVERVD